MSRAAPPERGPHLPLPNEFLQCARIIVRNFAYVFDQFLPIYPPDLQTERHARIILSVMQAFDGKHLLGWRAFRAIRVNGLIVSVAVVSWGSHTAVLLQTALAFVKGVAEAAPWQLPSCLRKAYAARAILHTPESRYHDMAILYIAAEEGQAKRGHAGELLKLLEIEAKARTLQGIVAAVRSYNAPARNLFRKHGFTTADGNNEKAEELLHYRKDFLG